MGGMKKICKEIIQQYKELDSTSISDALDRLGIFGAFYGLKGINSGIKMCGQAFTVRYVPCGVTKGTVGDFLDDVESGQVCVLDNGGRDYCTVWGDIMALYAFQKGIEGTVIDGVCRDIMTIKAVKYPIFTKGYYMVTGKDRVEVAEIGEPISVSGVKVCPDDLIFGDDTGVLAIPFEKAEEVLKIAVEIEQKEEEIRMFLKQGMTLRDARSNVGYHRLQTKNS
jgi:regulator of RNase E activity RraA